MNEKEETREEFRERIRKEYGPLYYDRQGKELKLKEWADKCEDMDYKIVKQETFDRWFISTVWIGLNMQVFRDNPIEIFETMIFMDNEEDKRDDPMYLYQERYSTEEEAMNGHVIALILCKAQLDSENQAKDTQSQVVENVLDSQSEDPAQ